MPTLKVTNTDYAGANLTLQIQMLTNTDEPDYTSDSDEDIKRIQRIDEDPKDLITECKLFNNTITCHFLVKFESVCRFSYIFVQLKDDGGLVKPYTLDHFYYLDSNKSRNNIEKEVEVVYTNSRIWQLIGAPKCNAECLHLKLIRDKCVPFKELYVDTDLPDFKLFGGSDDDTKGVTFHRNVLAHSSPVLKSMLLGNWKETRQGNVQLALVSGNTLQHFKDYIYLDNMPYLPMDCAKLLCLAGYYMLKQLPELERNIAKKMESWFCPQNLWEWLEFCVQHKNTQMLVMRLRHFQDAKRHTIIDIVNHFFNGSHKALFELKPKRASDKYCELYDDKDFTDFDLRTGDDNMYGSVDVHRNVIAAFSPVLKALFQNEWKKDDHGFIQLKNVSKRTLEQFKDFIYLQKVVKVSVSKSSDLVLT
ncbi:BTB/POZ domain-containing protein [Phthorimaea operculella]|nr:BTB/POZ domain-containing protein [Phthorimaea operculella]